MPNFKNIPAELKTLPQWVCFRLEKKEGQEKLAKIPYDPKTGRKAKANVPSTWGTYEQAVKAYSNGKYNGIGFEFSKNDPYTGVDIDDCIKNGVIEPWAQKIIDRLNSYSEFSLSGTGVHILVKAEKPTGRCRTKDSPEIYTTGRFFVVTGKQIPNTPATIESRQNELDKLYANTFNPPSLPKTVSKPAGNLKLSDTELIEEILKSKNGPKFKALFLDGDTSEYGDDHSAADLALCSILAFWTGKNHNQIDSLFRESGLMRDKWDKRHGEQTYGDMTISKAIAGTKETYKGKLTKKSTEIDKSTKSTKAELEKYYHESVRNIEFTPDNIAKLINYNCTDAGNAELFRDIVGNEYRFVPELGLWLKFNGVRWIKADERAKLQMLAIIRRRCDVASFTLSSQDDSDKRAKIIKFSLASETDNKLKSALAIARCMLTKSFLDFDADPFILCMENGVLDLRLNDGGFKKAKSDDYLHKYTPIKFDHMADCPRWLKFLDEIFMEDKNLIAFIQKATGYTLTGLTSAQCFFILYGTGANGKSVFLTILQLLLGDFSISTSMDTFKDHNSKNPQIPNDLAALCGKRFVKSSELKEGSRLNEERIKALTGDESIQARFLHKEFFDFFPKFKVWLGVNHKPVIKGTDEAIWRRPKLILFEAYFPPEIRDENLLNILKSELPGILLWALEGCHNWQREGLTFPNKIKEATQGYREESDIVGRFLEECTVQKEGIRVLAKDLYGSYKIWSEDSGEYTINQKMFGSKLTERGFIRVKDRTGKKCYMNLGQKTPE